MFIQKIYHIQFKNYTILCNFVFLDDREVFFLSSLLAEVLTLF